MILSFFRGEEALAEAAEEVRGTWKVEGDVKKEDRSLTVVVPAGNCFVASQGMPEAGDSACFRRRSR